MSKRSRLIVTRTAWAFFALELVAVLVGNRVGFWTEDTPVSRAVAGFMNRATQSTLPKRKTNKVVIVDLTGMTRVPCRLPLADGVKPTSRKQLYTLLQAVTAAEPAAVGLDIDFSLEWVPRGGSPSGSEPTVDYTLNGTDGDPEESDPLFFERVQGLLDQAPGTTIVLGAYRQAEIDPYLWFSKAPRPDLGELGATIPVFADSTDLVPVEHKSPNQSVWVPTMALALAKAARTDIPEKPDWLPAPFSVLVESRVSSGEPDGLGFHSIVVDYSAVESIRRLDWREVVEPASDAIRSEVAMLLKGNVVVCGYDDPTELAPDEVFNIPVRPWGVPGVMVHAASVDTLLGPGLFSLTATGKLGIEYTLFGLLALVSLLFELGAIRKGVLLDEDELKALELRLARRIVWMNVAATVPLLALFTAGVQLMRVLWLDLVVILVLHWLLWVVLRMARRKADHRAEPEASDVEGALT